MRKSAATVAGVALLLSLPQAPWRHIHTHGHDEHRTGTVFHAHHAPVSAAPSWRTHAPDEDARSISGLLSTSAARHVGHLVALVPALPALQAPPAHRRAFIGASCRGHDPPALSGPGSRAPPA